MKAEQIALAGLAPAGTLDWQKLARIRGALDNYVLVACEESGTVRDAFIRAGFKVISCDIKATRSPGPHYQGDVLKILRLHKWALVIAHPDCTFLTNSGGFHLHSRRLSPGPNGALFGPQRWVALFKGAEFFNKFADLPCPTCVENPKMHKYARALIRLPRTQYVQPFQFGHLETKETGLHLKGLPPLVSTNDVEAEMRLLPKKETHKVHYAGQGKSREDRAERRSVFFAGIADAMAAQWGHLIPEARAA